MKLLCVPGHFGSRKRLVTLCNCVVSKSLERVGHLVLGTSILVTFKISIQDPLRLIDFITVCDGVSRESVPTPYSVS